MTQSQKINRRNFLKYAGAGIIAVAAVGGGYYYYDRYQKLHGTINPTTLMTTFESTETLEPTGQSFSYDIDTLENYLGQITPLRNEIKEGVDEKLNKIFPTSDQINELWVGNWFEKTAEGILSRTGYIKKTYSEWQNKTKTALDQSSQFRQYQQAAMTNLEANKNGNIGFELIDQDGNNNSGAGTTLYEAKEQLKDNIKSKDFEKILDSFRYTIELEDMIDSAYHSLRLKLMSDVIDSHLFETNYLVNQSGIERWFVAGMRSLLLDNVFFDQEILRQLRLSSNVEDLKREQTSYQKTMQLLDASTRSDILRLIDESDSPYKHFSLRNQWYHTYTLEGLFAPHMKTVYDVGIARELDAFVRTIQPKVAYNHFPYGPNELINKYDGIADKFAAIGIGVEVKKDFRPDNWKNMSDEELDRAILKNKPACAYPSSAIHSLRYGLEKGFMDCTTENIYFNAVRSCCGRPPYSLHTDLNAPHEAHNEGLSERNSKFFKEGIDELESFISKGGDPHAPGMVISYQATHALGPGSLTFYLNEPIRKITKHLPIPPQLPSTENLNEILEMAQSLA
jgi:hypothetical protein